MKELILLGSTGSIGTQVIDVIQGSEEEITVVAMSCGENTELFAKQIKRLKPKLAVVKKEEDARSLGKRFSNTEFLWGKDGLITAVKAQGDLLVNGLVGVMGLAPTLAAIETGKDIALANKETLVVGGELVMTAAREKGIKIYPLDSEHSAIFQCLQGERQEDVEKLILTASGGPFLRYAPEALERVTPGQALKHPRWKMGRKITVDSATMVNKGLEVIEAKWLFDISLSRIQVLVHPQSIVHSMVEFKDGSIKAQLGVADMRLPIAYALHYPKREENKVSKLDLLHEGSKLTFEKADLNKFRALDLAYEAGKKGGTYPVVFNAANEVLVELFLNSKIKFTDITRGLDHMMNFHEPKYDLRLDDIFEADKETRQAVLDFQGEMK